MAVTETQAGTAKNDEQTKWRVLIVEDSAFFTSLICKRLASENLDITTAGTLEEARHHLQTSGAAFDLALLDLNLPDASGVIVVETVKEFGVPGIVFTGRYDAALAEKLFKIGVIDYITKDTPASLDYLHSVVRRVMANQSIKVLVVDDGSTARAMMVRLCRRYQLQAFEAADGREALEVIKEHPDIKLVLTDYHMPEMDGFELIRHLRETHAKTELAIIAISSAEKKGLSAQFIKTGANDFLSKPFEDEEFFCRISQNLDYLEHVEQLEFAATRDFLTGLRNRRSFFDLTGPMLAGARRRKAPPVVAMIDADHFKAVNDTYGHDTGDEVLKALARTIRDNTRDSDIVGRMGGEEFALYLADPDREKALAHLEKIRMAIAQIEVPEPNGDVIRPTVSIGAVSGVSGGVDGLLNQADARLYDAKNAGRNRVVLGTAD